MGRDNVDAYCEAILRLLQDRDLYDQKHKACLSLQTQFYDPARGWAAALRRALAV